MGQKLLKQGTGRDSANIDYTLALSPLGTMLVAKTIRGLCALWWGEGKELEELLKKRFPTANLTKDDESLAPLCDQINRHLEGESSLPELKLDAWGTPFQQQVWNALLTIPPGETRTYRQVAHMIGRPNAMRAVAGACGANPVALFIPCHRVIRSDGGFAGYRWGVDRKRRLLEIETGTFKKPTSLHRERKSS